MYSVQYTCTQPHQVHDGVQGEVGVGRDVSAEEALITQHPDQGGQLGGKCLGEVLIFLLDPLVAFECIDNPHDSVDILGRLMKSVGQGGLDRVLWDEAGLVDKSGHITIDGAWNQGF